MPLKMADAERILIERALDQNDGNIAAAARQLDVNRSRIYNFLKTRSLA